MKKIRIKYIADYKNALDKLLLDSKKTVEGKMFGYPAYYVNKKLAICHYHEGIVIKLPEEIALKIIKERNDCEPFCPSGKQMGKNWVILFPETVKDIDADKSLYLKSIAFVKSLINK